MTETNSTAGRRLRPSMLKGSHMRRKTRGEKDDRGLVPAIALAAISGLLLTAAFPKFDWHVLAWVALIPLFWAIQGKPLKTGFGLGFLTGGIHYVTLLYWITGVMKTYGQLPAVVSWAILLLLVLYLGLYFGAFCLLLTGLRQRSPRLIWITPFLWVGLEYLRAIFLSGFPWENLGYTQYNLLPLIQISDIFGVYGLSALIVAVNLVLFETWQAVNAKQVIPWKALLTVVCLVCACLAYGHWRIRQLDTLLQTAPEMSVALVQGNIDQSKKWDPAFQQETLKRYGRLTRRILEEKPSLVVWPETALPFYLFHDQPLTDRFIDLVRDSETPFLVGSPSFAKENGQVYYHNSAYLLNPDGGVLGKYDKVHLVPYGEYVPLKRLFPFLGKIVQAVGDFVPGRKGQVLSIDSTEFGVLICFEVIFPELGRAMALNGAQFLVNITNDAWFGRSSAPYQHMSMAVFRAVETRRAIARAANTGISAFIDPLGRKLKKTPLFREAVLTQSLPIMERNTLYVSWGFIFEKLCLGLLGVFAAWHIGAARFGKYQFGK